MLMIKWYWQLAIYLLGAVILAFLPKIWAFIKYYAFWDSSYQLIKFQLARIWDDAGIIEIQGGAGTGKTLLNILLIKYLDGKKWTNIPNIIPGTLELHLNILKDSYLGEFKEGLIGVNNLLFIDESWNFFSSKALQYYEIKKDLGNILMFLGQTSNTDFKIYFVSRKGIRLNPAFKILQENKSGKIITLGKRFFVRWWGKEYYYLDIRYKNAKALEYTKDKSKKKNWLTSWFSKDKSKDIHISIPFTQQDYNLFDKTWSLKNSWKRNYFISINEKLKADALTEMTKYKTSRRQELFKEEEAFRIWKRMAGRSKEMFNKGLEVARKRGFIKGAIKEIEEKEKNLEWKYKNSEITLEEYETQKQKLLLHKIAYNRKVAEIIASKELKEEPIKDEEGKTINQDQKIGTGEELKEEEIGEPSGESLEPVKRKRGRPKGWKKKW